MRPTHYALCNKKRVSFVNFSTIHNGRRINSYITLLFNSMNQRKIDSKKYNLFIITYG